VIWIESMLVIKSFQNNKIAISAGFIAIISWIMCHTTARLVKFEIKEKL
jgi:hypothetical protein